MHFKIAEQRIIPFLLQLIIRRSAKRRSKILILRIKQRVVSALYLIFRHDKKASDAAPF